MCKVWKTPELSNTNFFVWFGNKKKYKILAKLQKLPKYFLWNFLKTNLLLTLLSRCFKLFDTFKKG